MSMLETPPRTQARATGAPGISTCASAEGLAAILQPATELVIFRRALPSGLTNWLDQLDLAGWPMIRILVEPGALPAALLPLLDDAGVARCDPLDLLVDDIQDLAVRYAAIAGAHRVEVRLEPVSGDACWKFHRDCVQARLLTTYRGPATEWVQPEHADQALQEQRAYQGPLERLGNHDVALFKGSCAGAGSGIVHRSPPIAGTGIRRLLLCLNQPSATSPMPIA